MTSRTPSQDSENLSSYWCMILGTKWELSTKPKFPDLLENKSEHKSDNKSGKGSSNSKQKNNNSGSTQGKGSSSEREKSTTPNLSLKLGKDVKLTPQEHQCHLTTSFASFVAPLDMSQGLSKIPARLPPKPECPSLIRQIASSGTDSKKRLSSPQDSTWPEDCVELSCVKLLLSMHLLFQILTHSLFSWHPTPFQIWSWSPLWIPDLPTLSLILCLFRLSISQHMHSAYQTLTHW